MIHAVFVSKGKERERMYFINMEEYAKEVTKRCSDLLFTSADTVRADQIRQGRGAKVMEVRKDG